MTTRGEQASTENQRRQCPPCRGTGKLISTLAGVSHEVTCPWCGGTGTFQPGRDAQAGQPAETAT